MAITDRMRVYYKMEEATGATRADSISALNLTSNNNVAQVAGKNNNGAGFTTASSTYLSRTDHDYFSIDTSEDGFTVAFWAYPTVNGGTGGMVSKGYLNGGNHLEWQIEQRGADNAVVFYVSYNGSATVGCPSDQADSTNDMTINDWNFIACRYRSSDGQLTCRVNCNEDGVVTLTPNTPYNDTGAFNVGRFFNNVAGYWQGRIDELAIWQRYLTDAELDDLCLGTQFYPFAPQNTKVWSWAG